MYQDKKKVTIDNYMKSTGYTAESFLDALTLIVDFLDIVSNTLKKSKFLNGLDEIEGNDESYQERIVFPTYDNVSLKIGYVNHRRVDKKRHILDGEGVYFLDADFIYQRYLYFHSMKNLENEETIDINHNPYLNESDYYAYLLNVGVIEPFKECGSKPLKEINFVVDNDYSVSTKKCFRISCGTLWKSKIL